MATSVTPFLRVVANGVAARTDGRTRLKATLIATPEPGDQGIVDLADWPGWPRALAGRLREGKAPTSGRFQIMLYLRQVGVPGGPVPGAACTVMAEAAVEPDAWVGATAMWRKAFNKQVGDHGAMDPWDILAQDIARSLQGDKHEAKPQSQYDIKPTPPDPDRFDLEGAILARGPAAGEKAVVTGIVPVRQGQFALDEERVRACRVLAKMRAGSCAVAGEPELDLREPGEDEQKDFYNKRREKLYQNFYEAVCATNRERAVSQETFKKVEGLVSGNGTDAPTPFGLRDSRDLVPEAASVRSGSGRAETRASHAYGTWLQKKPPPGKQEAKAADDSAVTDRIRGVFYALQGDPILSRLFCLAVDLEFDLPRELQGKGDPLYLQIQAEHCEEAGRCTPAVATAAKLSGDSFWPVSIFEAGVNGSGQPISNPALVEQTDGFWWLDPGYAPDRPAAHRPRYDLTSLDIRRAVDAKPDAIDRGQRQLTAGFTILDHGRGEQVARDLALANTNAPLVRQAAARPDTRPCVCLYAEELTIGRHVDVACAAPGTAVDKLVWRSLMHRLVRYDKLGGGSEALLTRLLRDRYRHGRLIDEAAFQTAARLMPVIGGSASGIPVEAVTEEAVFLWDGTPAGALTDPGPDAEKKGKELPFERVLEPPSPASGTWDLCPAPLRYGASYVFRWRSMFLGGGSPPAAMAVPAAMAGRAILPPALCKTDTVPRVVPRRFLRHEGVLPPVLLLPCHLAARDLGPMGFEQADQAIVRSAVKADDPPGGTPTVVPGPDYVPLAQRTRPAETMRIFVVPEAAPKTVERHGKLDVPDPAGVLQGGLRDVAFDPAPRSTDPGKKATGFPTVLTKSAQGFGQEPVSYSRVISRGKGEEIGIPIFEAGGRNTTARGQIGYLPDPAVEEMSVRLRVNRSRRYLAGDIAVEVYDERHGIAYPRALPLVVTVRRSERDRAAPAQAIGEVIVGNGAALRWLDAFGTLTDSPPLGGRGTRVRHLVVELCRGEDFHLEVACLPKPETLAAFFSVPETIAMQLAEAAANTRHREQLQQLAGPLDPAHLAACGGDRYTGLGGRLVPGGGAVLQTATDILTTIKRKWPIEEIAAVTTLRVCHAVNAPPALVGTVPNRYVARRLKPEAWRKDPELRDQPGENTLLLTGELKLDLERIDAFELVATSALASARPLDDKTRSRSLIARRSGRWPKLTTGEGKRPHLAPRFVVGFDLDADGRAVFPQDTVTLLRVDNLPSRAGNSADGNELFGATQGRLTSVNLGRLFAAALTDHTVGVPIDGDVPPPPEAGKPDKHVVKAAPPHIIADTRARRLMLRVTALSRSAEAFDAAPRYHSAGEPLLHRRQVLRPNEQSRSSEPVELWVPATVRPPACEVRRPEVTPVIIRRADNGKNGIVQTVTRKMLTRLYLKRGWYASGEGERLGIVLWPPDYFKQTERDIDGDLVRIDGREVSIAELDDGDLGPAGAFITRWGGDPTRHDARPQQGMLIPPGAFADAAEGCTSPHRPQTRWARMPIRRNLPDARREQNADPQETPDDFMEVTLLTYEPCFDLDREEWYVDIDLIPSRAGEPFVRFGLVRYQENAISDELKVSYPIAAHAQIMPRRELKVQGSVCADGTPALAVTLSGYGSIGTKPIEIERLVGQHPQLAAFRASFERLARPEVRVTVFHERTVEGGRERTVLRTPLSRSERWVTAAGKLDVAMLQWQADVPLPEDRIKELGAGTLIAYVEEVDRRMPASYPNEPIAPADLFERENFRSSGPRFSARIPFREVT
jgi:hypothetical protein